MSCMIVSLPVVTCYANSHSDGDTMVTMKCYPKHALQNKKTSASSSRKRQRQDSSVESQEIKQVLQPQQQSQEDDGLVQSTRHLELDHQNWDYHPRIPDGLPEAPPPVNSFFPESTSFRSYAPVPKQFSDPSDLQPAYQQTPMMPPQVYDDRYAFDAKQPSTFMDNSTYPMSRDPSYVSQPSNYNDWRTVQSNSSFSPSSTTSLAQSSNTSYTTPSNTNFPGTVNYSFGANQQLSPQHNYSPGPQVGAISAASPAMGQIAVSAPLPVMPGMRSQPGSFDEPYSNTFRTGSLSHPNVQYNMSSSHYG